MRKVSILSNAAALLALATVLFTTACPNPAASDSAVTNLDIPGVTAPVAGAAPVLAVDDAQYSGTVAWSPAVASAFAASTEYTATIVLSPKSGFSLAGVKANAFTVAGAGSASNAADSGTVTAVFPATMAPIVPGLKKRIDLLAVPGVTIPATGDTPSNLPINNAQYSGTIVWSPSVDPTFAAHTAYTADIELTPKEGWTLSGIPANSFMVAGAAATTHAAGSGSIKAAFPATFAAPILSLVRVPAGRFQRDATATNISVITKSYYMSRYEITRAQFLSVMGTDPTDTAFSSGSNHDPVQMVNWYHAIAFCNKLSLREGYAPIYAVAGISDWKNLSYSSIPISTTASWNNASADWDADGYRLPTEMEWMWAAMAAPADGQGGGTNTTGYGKAFAGSTGANDIGGFAVFGYTGSETGRTTTERTDPVGSKNNNELGLFDMSGNVYEWCWDRNSAYPAGTNIDYRGGDSGAVRIVRGGCWSHSAYTCSVAERNYTNPGDRFTTLGFRVVRP